MLAHRQFVPWIAALFFSVPLAAPVELTWRGSKLEIAELPEELPAGARDAVRFWRPWADEHGYRMELSADGRSLLLTLDDSSGRKRAKKNLALSENVLQRMDAILPLPPARAEAVEPAKASDGTYEWGSAPLESATAVLMELDALEHHASAVDFLVEGHDYLKPWGSAAKGLTGYVLEQPLVAAWQPKAGIKEDWEGDATSEMVNKLAQLMTLRRFGRLPYWLGMGIAWHVEMEELDGVYCFPYRSGFVSASEHGNWDKALRNRLKSREEPLALSELTQLKRGTFDLEAAHMAWATVTFLSRHHPGVLSEVCDELHRIWDEQGRVTNGDGTWTRIPEFEPSDEQQLAVFEAHVPGFLTELQAFCVKGAGYKKP